jgi:hypothetical protein
LLYKGKTIFGGVEAVLVASREKSIPAPRSLNGQANFIGVVSLPDYF